MTQYAAPPRAKLPDRRSIRGHCISEFPSSCARVWWRELVLAEAALSACDLGRGASPSHSYADASLAVEAVNLVLLPFSGPPIKVPRRRTWKCQTATRRPARSVNAVMLARRTKTRRQTRLSSRHSFLGGRLAKVRVMTIASRDQPRQQKCRHGKTLPSTARHWLSEHENGWCARKLS